MLKVCKNFIALGLALVILLTGCGIISVTFLLNEDIDTTSVPTDLFIYNVDVTDEEDWEDHKDDIQQVNWVSFEFYLTNPGGADVTFDGYIDDIDNSQCGTIPCAEAATRVLKDITIPAGSSVHISHGNSFSYMENMSIMKDLAEAGAFHFYGVADGGAFILDSGSVVVAIVAAI